MFDGKSGSAAAATAGTASDASSAAVSPRAGMREGRDGRRRVGCMAARVTDRTPPHHAAFGPSGHRTGVLTVKRDTAMFQPMPDDPYTIADLARLAGVTPRTVRYYVAQ